MVDLQVGVGGKGEGGGAAAEVVQSDRWQVELFDELAETVAEVFGSDRTAVGVGEQRFATLAPAGAGVGSGIAAAQGDVAVFEQFDRLLDGLVE